ncbi:MAG: DNA polymerase III subunit delta' [Candidatus Dormibacteria bacterium]
MPISDVVGHRPAIAQLERALAGRSLAHAILLTGPSGVGKTTLAEALAGAVLEADRWPGGLAAHPDHWLEDSEVERISIRRVRAGGRSEDSQTLQDFLSLRPYAGGGRVAVIARAERLNEEAANTLLKTIEEPPPGTHLLLCTGSPERLPATILSRCQTIGCTPVPAPAIEAWLTGRLQVDAELARTAAALSGGRPGRARRLATEPGVLAAEVEAIDALLRVGGSGRSGALQAAARLAPGAGAEGRDRALAQVSAWTSFVRDVACFNAGAPELAVWTAFRPALERWAESLPAARVTQLLDRLLATSGELVQYAAPRLAYEVLFLDIFGGSPAPPPTLDAVREHIVQGPAAIATQRSRPRTVGRRHP